MFKSFNPGIPLTISTLLAFSFLVFLGTWQALKVETKTALLDRIEAGLKAEAIVLPLHLDNPAAVEYQKIKFSGVRTADPIKVFGINTKGKSGYFLYAPVKREHGQTVIVNFGWMPHAMTNTPELPSGQFNLSGVLMLSATRGTMTLENDIKAGNWYLADVHQIAAYFGLETKEYYHFRVFADHVGHPDAMPVGAQVRVNIPNDHFEYALTWYGLAAGLIGVYLVFGASRGRKTA